MTFFDTKEPSPEGLKRVRQLSGKYGLVSRSLPLFPVGGEPNFSIQTSILGDPSAVLLSQRDWSHDKLQGNFDGAGGAIDPERARDISIAESLERYSSCSWSNDDFVFAAEVDLDAENVRSPNLWPRCSEAELSEGKSGLKQYDPRIPIRWKRAWSLTERREVLVPASLVYLRFPAFSQSELFTHSVSTGTAAHSVLSEAVLNGLYEVIERDSVALTWLQRLQLPSIEVQEETLSSEVLSYHKLGTSSNLSVRLFDATTDFGVPVIYGVQLSEDDLNLSQIVAAASDLNPHKALTKIHREFASLRIALRSPSFEGKACEGLSVVGGALYQGQRSQRDVFKFLLEGSRPSKVLDDLIVPVKEDSPKEKLSWIVDKLSACNAEVIVADLTTDEARQVDFSVVKVLVPQAMPLSFVHAARYLATPRLYQAPKVMGYTVYDESCLNHEYQPFA